MFISYLKFKNLLCHDDQIVIGKNRIIQCAICGKTILDVNQYLIEENNYLLSCQVAHYYAQWSGDIHVPCKIILAGIPGILPNESLIITYADLMNVIEILSVLNQEFIQVENRGFIKNPGLTNKILDGFIKKYITMVSDLNYEDKDISEIIKTVLNHMKDSFEDSNIFDHYVNVLCPYVKSCYEGHYEPIRKTYNQVSPGELFKQLSDDATEIRTHFGKYSLPFDIIYIMIYCYLSHSNLNIVANFAIDLIARICRGYFNDKNKYHIITANIIDKSITYKQNTKLYYLIQCIRQGESRQHISTEFLEKYKELQQLIVNEFNRTISTPSEAIQKYAFSQSFPFVLFPNGSNYYGFMCTLGYLMQYFKTNFSEKGIFSNAKKIYKFIEMYSNKFNDFEKSGDPIIYWNIDMFQLFLGSDKNLVNQIKELFTLFGSNQT